MTPFPLCDDIISLFVLKNLGRLCNIFSSHHIAHAVLHPLAHAVHHLVAHGLAVDPDDHFAPILSYHAPKP